MKYIFAVILLFTLHQNLFSQTENLQVGSNNPYRGQGGFYDYSEPEAINIKVAIWGFVKFPGKYIIPENSSINDLISFAGGPTEDAKLKEMSVYRIGKDSVASLENLNYDELLWNKENVKAPINSKIQPGDILLVPGDQRLYFRDYLSLTLSVVSTLISLSILILNIAN
ncbi:MAG: SLBB domain-containing protein [Syntrophothermus sp.]|nr:SLBB domain-containing protein [Ignavibacteriaceae bacterium]